MNSITTPQSAALSLIIDKVKSEIKSDIIIAPLPEEGGITAEISSAENKGRYLNNKHGKESLTVLFLCKNTSQSYAYNVLCAIGNSLNALKPIEGENVTISGAEVRNGAGLVGNDGGFYVYSMIAAVNIIF